jgi:integrase
MRKDELLAVHREDIDWENHIITVKQAMYPGEMTSTKSNKIQHIPMVSKVYECLYARKKRQGFVFIDERGKHFNRWRFDDALRQISKRAAA